MAGSCSIGISSDVDMVGVAVIEEGGNGVTTCSGLMTSRGSVVVMFVGVCV